jgi:sarcosine oxidase subunit beta
MGSTLEFLATCQAAGAADADPRRVRSSGSGPAPISAGQPGLGAAPEHPDFFLACGFVGHGFMMAPIVGKLYAEWLTGAPPHEIFSRYTLTRFRDGSSDAFPKEDFNIG